MRVALAQFDFPVGDLAGNLRHSLECIESAKAGGGVLRYIGRIENGRCSVSVNVVPQDSPLGSVRDGENALVLHTHYYQPIPLVLRGYGAGADVTAAGVFGDLLRTAWRPLDL